MKWNIITNFIFGRGEPRGRIRVAASQRKVQTAFILCSSYEEMLKTNQFLSFRKQHLNFVCFRALGVEG